MKNGIHHNTKQAVQDSNGTSIEKKEGEKTCTKYSVNLLNYMFVHVHNESNLPRP